MARVSSEITRWGRRLNEPVASDLVPICCPGSYVAARGDFVDRSGGLPPVIPARRFSVGINSVPAADFDTKAFEKTCIALTNWGES